MPGRSAPDSRKAVDAILAAFGEIRELRAWFDEEYQRHELRSWGELRDTAAILLAKAIGGDRSFLDRKTGEWHTSSDRAERAIAQWGARIRGDPAAMFIYAAAVRIDFARILIVELGAALQELRDSSAFPERAIRELADEIVGDLNEAVRVGVQFANGELDT